METTKTLSHELLGAAKTLRRAAVKAKQEAERLGAPYVVESRKYNASGETVFIST